MRQPATDLRRRNYVTRHRKPSQNPFRKAEIFQLFRKATRCDTKPYHHGEHNMSASIPYRSIVGASGPEVVPLSYPDKTPISGHRTALPRERHHFPVKNCQIRSFPQSVSRSSCSSINRAVAFAARRGPSYRAVALRKNEVEIALKGYGDQKYTHVTSCVTCASKNRSKNAI